MRYFSLIASVLLLASAIRAGGVNPYPIQSLNGDTTPAQVFVTSTAGSVFMVSTDGHGTTTFQVPNANPPTQGDLNGWTPAGLSVSGGAAAVFGSGTTITQEAASASANVLPDSMLSAI